MRVTRQLERIGPNQELSILVQSVEGLPAIEGSAAGGAGEDLVCPGCGESLAVGIDEGELYDIAFVCPKCGTLSRGPTLPAGVSLPWGKTVVIDPGQYRISETLRFGGGAVVAGKSAVERRLRETGSPVAVAEGRELTADLLDDMVDDVKALLGSDYAAVRASYERGKNSRTPPREPHRLMELVDRAEETAASIRAGAPKLDAVATVELDAALGAVKRWRSDPAWPGIVKPLSGEGHQYRHAVIALAAASFLADAGNAVELAREPGDRRMADIRVRYGADLYGRVEVKAPGPLARPAKPIKSEAAFKIVDKAVSSAMVGSFTNAKGHSNGLSNQASVTCSMPPLIGTAAQFGLTGVNPTDMIEFDFSAQIVPKP